MSESAQFETKLYLRTRGAAALRDCRVRDEDSATNFAPTPPKSGWLVHPSTSCGRIPRVGFRRTETMHPQRVEAICVTDRGSRELLKSFYEPVWGEDKEMADLRAQMIRDAEEQSRERRRLAKIERAEKKRAAAAASNGNGKKGSDGQKQSSGKPALAPRRHDDPTLGCSIQNDSALGGQNGTNELSGNGANGDGQKDEHPRRRSSRKTSSAHVDRWISTEHNNTKYASQRRYRLSFYRAPELTTATLHGEHGEKPSAPAVREMTQPFVSYKYDSDSSSSSTASSSSWSSSSSCVSDDEDISSVDLDVDDLAANEEDDDARSNMDVVSSSSSCYSCSTSSNDSFSGPPPPAVAATATATSVGTAAGENETFTDGSTIDATASTIEPARSHNTFGDAAGGDTTTAPESGAGGDVGDAGRSESKRASDARRKDRKAQRKQKRKEQIRAAKIAAKIAEKAAARAKARAAAKAAEKAARLTEEKKRKGRAVRVVYGPNGPMDGGVEVTTTLAHLELDETINLRMKDQSMNLHALASMSSVHGINSNGSGAVAVVSNPVLISLKDRFLMLPKVINDTFNAVYVHVAEKESFFTVIVPTQEGRVVTVRTSTSPDVRFNVSLLATLASPANDVAVLESSSGRRLVFICEDSHTARLVLLGPPEGIHLAPPAQVAPRAMAGDIDTDPTIQWSKDITLQHESDVGFFVYAAFSESGEFLCACNDVGQYAMVWQVVWSSSNDGSEGGLGENANVDTDGQDVAAAEENTVGLGGGLGLGGVDEFGSAAIGGGHHDHGLPSTSPTHPPLGVDSHPSINNGDDHGHFANANSNGSKHSAASSPVIDVKLVPYWRVSFVDVDDRMDRPRPLRPYKVKSVGDDGFALICGPCVVVLDAATRKRDVVIPPMEDKTESASESTASAETGTTVSDGSHAIGGASAMSSGPGASSATATVAASPASPNSAGPLPHHHHGTSLSSSPSPPPTQASQQQDQGQGQGQNQTQQGQGNQQQAGGGSGAQGDDAAQPGGRDAYRVSFRDHAARRPLVGIDTTHSGSTLVVASRWSTSTIPLLVARAADAGSLRQRAARWLARAIVRENPTAFTKPLVDSLPTGRSFGSMRTPGHSVVHGSLGLGAAATGGYGGLGGHAPLGASNTQNSPARKPPVARPVPSPERTPLTAVASAPAAPLGASELNHEQSGGLGLGGGYPNGELSGDLGGGLGGGLGGNSFSPVPSGAMLGSPQYGSPQFGSPTGQHAIHGGGARAGHFPPLSPAPVMSRDDVSALAHHHAATNGHQHPPTQPNSGGVEAQSQGSPRDQIPRVAVSDADGAAAIGGRTGALRSPGIAPAIAHVGGQTPHGFMMSPGTAGGYGGGLGASGISGFLGITPTMAGSSGGLLPVRPAQSELNSVFEWDNFALLMVGCRGGHAVRLVGAMEAGRFTGEPLNHAVKCSECKDGKLAEKGLCVAVCHKCQFVICGACAVRALKEEADKMRAMVAKKKEPVDRHEVAT